MAEKLRSNEMLLKAVNTYREAAELSDAPADLIKASLKRRADRQQFLGKTRCSRTHPHISRSTLNDRLLTGRTRGSLATLERLVQVFPEDITLKNDLGVAHLLIGDNKGAKRVYEEVMFLMCLECGTKHVNRILVFALGKRDFKEGLSATQILNCLSLLFAQVLAVVPSDGFAKVHYGFILKAENKIAESIPYLKVSHI